MDNWSAPFLLPSGGSSHLVFPPVCSSRRCLHRLRRVSGCLYPRRPGSETSPRHSACCATGAQRFGCLPLALPAHRRSPYCLNCTVSGCGLCHMFPQRPPRVPLIFAAPLPGPPCRALGVERLPSRHVCKRPRARSVLLRCYPLPSSFGIPEPKPPTLSCQSAT